MKIEIKHKWTAKLLFEYDADSLKIGLEIAVKNKINLRGADLEGADLGDIKKDFFERLSKAKAEVSGLYDALIRGKINGSSYKGECACFCGTIANIRKENYAEMKIDLRPDSNCPTERWFLAIRKGDTPENNQVSAVTADWLKEFMKANEIAIPQYKLVSSIEKPELF